MTTLGPLIQSSRLDALVRDVMRPGIVTVSDRASLLQVQRAMASHRVHAVLVVEVRNGRPLGWVTARRLVTLADRDPHFSTAGAAVTEPPIWVSPSATARDARDQLLATGQTHVLVGHPECNDAEGVVSDLDIVELVAGQAKSHR